MTVFNDYADKLLSFVEGKAEKGWLTYLLIAVIVIVLIIIVKG